MRPEFYAARTLHDQFSLFFGFTAVPGSVQHTRSRRPSAYTVRGLKLLLLTRLNTGRSLQTGVETRAFRSLVLLLGCVARARCARILFRWLTFSPWLKGRTVAGAYASAQSPVVTGRAIEGLNNGGGAVFVRRGRIRHCGFPQQHQLCQARALRASLCVVLAAARY